MVSITNQGNANQNPNEMPLYITRITIIKKSNVGEGVEKLEPSETADGNVK